MRTFLAAVGGGLVVAAAGLPLGLLLITLGCLVGTALGWLLIAYYFG